MIFFSIALGLTFVKMIYKINYIPDIRDVGNYINGAGKVVVKTIDVMKYYVDDKSTQPQKLLEDTVNKEQDDERYQIKPEENKLDTNEKSVSNLPNNLDAKEIEKTVRSLYLFESAVAINPQDMNLNKLANKNLKVNFNNEKPKVLIFHTHSQETFSDSRGGNEEDSVIGVGDRLVEVLYEKYKIKAIHHKGKYDVVNGKLCRGGSYERASTDIEKVLKENPEIEVVIDIHRDGIPNDKKLITEINKRKTAKIMFVNGVCEKITNGKMQKINSLPNKYISDNLALSLQMQLEANKLYPSLMRKILIKPYRYSLYMRPKSLLVEVGAQTNTVAEVKNAMEPLSDVLAKVVK